MPDLLVVATLPGKSGLPKDAVVNNFAFSMPGGFAIDGTSGDALINAVSSFYGATPTGMTDSVSARLSASVDRVAGTTLDVYDITGHLDGSPHGSPIRTESIALDAASNSAALPREVALCVTLRGVGWETALVEVPDGSDPGSAVDRPKQRHTGRLYLGPLNYDCDDTAVGGYESRPTSAFRDIVHAACQDLADAARAAISGGKWCVWSRRMEFLHTIEDIQTDDAWDIQRRRGAVPTVRTTVDTSS